MLLADDQEAIIEEVTGLLAFSCEVVGAVSNGDLLVQAASSLDPDIIVVDICMPVMSGLEAVTELKKRGCRARIVFLTVFEDQCYVDACFSAGADAYVVKARLTFDLVPAVNEVVAGRTFVSNINVERPSFRL